MHSKVRSAGHVIVGGVMSSTVIVWVHCVVLPQLSVAIYVRVMIRGHVPFHTSPSQVTTGVPQLSLATTSVISGAGTSVMHSKVRSAGHVIVGGVMSSTVIVWVHCVVLPQLSVAIYVRVMIRGHVPFHTSPSQVTTGVPFFNLTTTSEISALALHVILSMFRSAGHVIVGGVMSSTVI